MVLVGNGLFFVFEPLSAEFWAKFSRLCRVFLNLCIAKPMVCMQVAFHENVNDGKRDNSANDEDNSDSYKQGVERWISGNHGNHRNDENPRESGVQTTGSSNNGFRNLQTLGCGLSCSQTNTLSRRAMLPAESSEGKVPSCYSMGDAPIDPCPPRKDAYSIQALLCLALRPGSSTTWPRRMATDIIRYRCSRNYYTEFICFESEVCICNGNLCGIQGRICICNERSSAQHSHGSVMELVLLSARLWQLCICIYFGFPPNKCLSVTILDTTMIH